MTIEEIGCCGAYCRTCRSYVRQVCRGCKVGYSTGERSLARARCRVKVCCLAERRHHTCADCPDFASCADLGRFHGQPKPAYPRYRATLDYIRQHGYERFLQAAAGWRAAHGQLD